MSGEANFSLTSAVGRFIASAERTCNKKFLFFTNLLPLSVVLRMENHLRVPSLRATQTYRTQFFHRELAGIMTASTPEAPFIDRTNAPKQMQPLTVLKPAKQTAPVLYASPHSGISIPSILSPMPTLIHSPSDDPKTPSFMNSTIPASSTAAPCCMPTSRAPM